MQTVTKPVPVITWIILLVSMLLGLQTLFVAAIAVPAPWLIGLIFIVGMPHGALDIVFAKRVFAYQRWQSWCRFVSGYLLFSAAIFLSWWWLPTISLLAFLALSAYHFADDVDADTPHIFKWIHGMLILSLPALLYPHTLIQLYQLFSDSPHIERMVTCFGWVAMVGLWLAIILVLWRFLHKQSQPTQTVWLEMLSTWLLMLVCPPLLAFTIYFCVLHSPKHIQRAQLFFNTTLAELITWPMVLATITVMLTGLWMLSTKRTLTLDQGLIAMTFPLLASLTYPHVLLLHRAHFNAVTQPIS